MAELLRAFPSVVVIEECAPTGGLSQQVKEIAWDTGARAKIHTFTLKDEFIHCYGSHDDLLDAHGLSVAEMTRRILG
jgi:transketolase